MDRIDDHDGPSAARRSGLSPDAFARITRRSRGRDGSSGITWVQGRARRARRGGLRHADGVGHVTWTREAAVPVASEA
jgi:hypothetical protein